MKKKHRVLSLLLAFAMMLTFMPAMAFGLEEDPEPATKPAEFTIGWTNGQYVVDPVDPVYLDFESDAVAVVNVKASRLVQSSNQDRNITFTVKANQTGDWEDAAGTAGTGTPTWGKLDAGDTVTFNMPVNSLQTKYEYGWTFTKGDVKGTLTVNLDFTETDVFRSRTNRDPQYGDAYFADSQYLIKWSDGAGEFSEDKEAWEKMKAEEAAAKFMNEYNAAVQAQKDADASKAAAEEAMKTPGDAAVEAAQKALDDAKKAEQAAKDLGKALDKLENIDELYIDNAKGLVPEYAAALEDAQDNIATADNYAALEKGIDKAEMKLTEAKSENAAKKASEDAKKASDDKAAAEKSAAAAAAYRYTPKRSKVNKVKPAKKSAVVSFKRVYGSINGYQIQLKDKKTGKTKIIKVKKSSKKTISKKIKGLKKNRKYSVKVRAFHTVKGKTYYAAWSEAKGFKTKK